MFDGATYDEKHDRARLNTQLARVYHLMKDGRPRTLEEIRRHTGGELTSVSARLRDLRKPKFGGFVVKRTPVGDRSNGLFEYTLVLRKEERTHVQMQLDLPWHTAGRETDTGGGENHSIVAVK
jgi:hypothetical protein